MIHKVRSYLELGAILGETQNVKSIACPCVKHQSKNKTYTNTHLTAMDWEEPGDI